MIDEIPVELYIAVRWTISGLVFALMLLFGRLWMRISVKDFMAVSLLGIFGYALASAGTLYGLKTGGVINFALVGALSPAITSLVAIAVLRERPARKFYFALPLLTLGLILLVLGKYQSSSLQIVALGLIFILGGYILEALVFIYSKKFKDRMSTVQYLAVAQLSAAAFAWMLQLSYFHQSSFLFGMSAKAIGAAVFVSLIACVLCYLVLYWLLNHLDGHVIALFDGVHSLSAIICGYFLFREKLTLIMALGGVLILCGIIIGNWPKRKVRAELNSG